MAKQSIFRLFGQPKMAALLFLGFASGMPLYLTSQTLQAWMTNEGVDLTTIGAFCLVALPYSLKFAWAPLLDRYVPPFLGRRRGWMLIVQMLLMFAIGWMAFRDPKNAVQFLAVNAIIIAFLSATYDAVFDGYKVDVLETHEMGAGAAMSVLGYRIALIVTGSIALVLADRMTWPTVYLIMAAAMIIGIIATLRAPEPLMQQAPPQTLADAVILPFKEFFTRAGVVRGFAILLFIVLYKLPDYLGGAMSTPFLLQTGFTQTQIGTIKGGLGLIATIVGTLAGGAVVARLGINRSLWIFGALQALSNLMYYLLSLMQQSMPMLIATMIVENFCLGLVTAGFVAFLMSLCNIRFSATQYALLSSLMAVSRDVLVAPSGGIAEATGWPTFFIITLVVAIPGLLLLPFFAPWNRDEPVVAATHTGEVKPADAV